jgi:hypothetical protein
VFDCNKSLGAPKLRIIGRPTLKIAGKSTSIDDDDTGFIATSRVNMTLDRVTRVAEDFVDKWLKCRESPQR